jgi:predicted DsbA family dithiol-disulfide isomerase
LQKKYDFEIDWRGFELHPETPVGGMNVAELFGAQRIAAMQEHIKGFAQKFGINDMQSPPHLPNTRRAMAVAEYARSQGLLEPYRIAAMNAYWRKQLNLEDDTVLKNLAQEVGLDAEAALAATQDEAVLARVDALHTEANAAGVQGIPTFFIGAQRIVGCQPVEVIERALLAAGAQSRQADKT